MMTNQEAMERAAECRATAQRAIAQHNLAMTAFNVACARHDWELAEKEHRTAIDHLDAYLIAMAATYRLVQEMGA